MSIQSHLSRWLRKYPFLILAVPAMAGILWVERFSWQPSTALAIVTLLVGLIALWKPLRWLKYPGVFLLFAFLHAHRLSDTYSHPLRLHLQQQPRQSEDVTLRGRLYPWTEGAEMDDKAVFCWMEEWRGHRDAAFTRLTAPLKVRLPAGYVLESSGLYELRGTLSLPRRPANPGQFDSANHALRKGWVATLKAWDIQQLQADTFSPRFHLLHAAENSRQWMIQKLSLGLEAEGRHTGVILAMALGASDAAGEEIEDAFRDSGTLHVFAVSGLHVVMLAHIASVAFRALGKQRLNVLIIFFVFAYAFMTGWLPSAARSAFMMSLMLLAPLLHRRSQMANALGVAALLLLLLDTHQLFLVGFQLSFGVVFAILLIGSRLDALSRPWWALDAFLPATLATLKQRTSAKLRFWLASTLAVSLAAWIGSLPFLIGHFQTLTPVALISNLFLVLLSGICLILSCVSLACTLTHWSGLVIAVNQMNGFLAKVMVGLATWFAGLPGANQTLNFQKSPPADAAEIRVFHLPFGGGASYLRGGDQHWLIDTGSESHWRYVLRPFLHQQGVKQLQGLILSHADIGHTGATASILKAHPASRIHTSVLEPWPKDPPFASLKQLSKNVTPDGPHWQRHEIDTALNLTNHSSTPLSVKILYPGPLDLYEKANDRGLILMIQAGDFRVLWLSDAGFIAEKKLLERRIPIQCDIVVRHQHSADVSGLTELLIAANPQVILSSNDAYRLEELIPQRLRDYCAKQQIPLFDLEADGSVGMVFQGGEARIQSQLSERTIKLTPRSAGLSAKTP